MVLTAPTTPPMEHQWKAIEEILDNPNLLIEYGTGTGKTRILVETVKVLVAAGEVPVVIIVPNSLIDQTIDEFEEWAGKKWTAKHVHALDDTTTIYMRREALKRGRASVYVLSTEALSYGLVREGLYARNWAAAFIDEASKFRNHSKRTVTLRGLGQRSRSRYAMTGNLMVRAPTDVWYVTNWLRPGFWGTTDLKTFKSMYCIFGGWQGSQCIAVRPDKLKEFKARMDQLRIQCELSDVRDLPPRSITVRKVRMHGEQEDLYHAMRTELEIEIERTSDEAFRSQASTYAVRLLRLQEICAGFARNPEGDVHFLPSPKTTELLDMLEDSPHVPTVVWYWWRPELDIITARLRKAGFTFSVFGQPDAINRFMSGDTDIIISQLAKGGYGLNLTRAERMFYHSLPWDLDVYSQSQERNMRLTTTADHLEIVHAVVRQSADEYVRMRLLQKADMSAQLSRSQALALLRGVTA